MKEKFYNSIETIVKNYNLMKIKYFRSLILQNWNNYYYNAGVT